MQQDQKLQELLLLGSQQATADFTATVMNRVQKLSATPFYCQPLVSSARRKVFVVIVLALIAAIFLVCFLLASPGLSFPGWPVLQYVVIFTEENFYTILAYIICFWILFAANAFVEKKRGHSTAAAL